MINDPQSLKPPTTSKYSRRCKLISTPPSHPTSRKPSRAKDYAPAIPQYSKTRNPQHRVSSGRRRDATEFPSTKFIPRVRQHSKGRRKRYTLKIRERLWVHEYKDCTLHTCPLVPFSYTLSTPLIFIQETYKGWTKRVFFFGIRPRVRRW